MNTRIKEIMSRGFKRGELVLFAATHAPHLDRRLSSFPITTLAHACKEQVLRVCMESDVLNNERLHGTAKSTSDCKTETKPQTDGWC